MLNEDYSRMLSMSNDGYFSLKCWGWEGYREKTVDHVHDSNVFLRWRVKQITIDWKIRVGGFPINFEGSLKIDRGGFLELEIRRGEFHTLFHEYEYCSSGLCLR